MPTFVAIDFETADRQPDSACALALVKAADGEIVARRSFLIRPPRRRFVFTEVHGIRWRDVEHAPTFGELWPEIAAFIDGAAFLAAHHAPFDRGVLTACCACAGVTAPSVPFRCTVKIARRVWGIFPTKLPNVCRRLGIELDHHDALSDADACARIVLAAQAAEGATGAAAGAWEPADLRQPRRRGGASGR
ncbi:MAG: 3'-5' exonuclease [Deltaproteobacteria bacterium]|nr:3'-5' exonuclease [Deltaproteobacteria bacterium]